MNDADALFRAGQLRAAIDAQTAAVRAAPTDAAKRWFLVELLCFAGERERADRMLDLIASQAAEPTHPALQFRQLLRGEETRRQVLLEGRIPTLVGPNAANLQAIIEVLLLLRLGERRQAADQLAQAPAAAPISGRRNDLEFHDFRDLDDVLEPLLEVIGPDGEYRWVAACDVARLELQPLARPRDLLWRPAQIALHSGSEGEIWLPCLYVSDEPTDDEALKLGRRSDWVGEADGPVRGLGLRTFLVGDEDVPIHELGVVEFTPPEPGQQ